MPEKQDELTQRIVEAYRVVERIVCGHWASGLKLFGAGYRKGYEDGRNDERREVENRQQSLTSS